MKLTIAEITGKTKYYKLDNGGWSTLIAEDGIVSAHAELAVFRRDKETVVIEGSLEFIKKSVCDRCEHPFEQKLFSDFFYQVIAAEEQVSDRMETECSDDAVTTLYRNDPEIDIDEILREQGILAIPVKALCSEDCQGLCPGCGAVLSDEKCRCVSDNSNSPFAVLEKLRK